MGLDAKIDFGEFSIRPYDHAKDIKSIQRIWRECGWHLDADESFVEDFFSVGHAVVAALDDEAECAAHVTPGTIRYQDDDLNLCAVTSVNTSPIARKRGLGTAVTAHAIAQAACNGAKVAALGIFEQGYYDKLGFGSGNYEHIISFDPADLKQKCAFRVPRRLTSDEWRAMHDALKSRWLGHGGCVLTPPEIVKAETGWKTNGYGLGYFDDQGELTHFLFGKLEGSNGPLSIDAVAYQNGEQLLELFALLRSLGDQVSCVTMIEPPHIQLQDLLKQPFRFRRLSEGSSHENRLRASSFWQLRILDLENCLSKTHLYGRGAEFDLVLTDAIQAQLQASSRKQWAGIAGEYTVYLGEDSTAKRGTRANLPTLHASVNAFSRLWFGIRPATQLAISDDLSGPTELLADLDDVLCLPTAALGWYF